MKSSNPDRAPSVLRQIEWASVKQEWAFSRGPFPTLLAGGQDSAKTTAFVLKLLSLHQTYPGSRSAIVRRAYNHLTKTTMESFFQWCKPEFYRPYGDFNKNNGILDYNNGSRTYFLHLDHPDSLDVLQGLDLNFGYVSQAEEIEETAWDFLDVRLGRWVCPVPESILAEYPGGAEAWPWRSEDRSQIVPPSYLFAEGYVTDEGHWLYRRFAEESPERTHWKSLGYECKIVNSTENKFANKEVTKKLLSKPPEFIRRYVIPQWGNPEGQMFNLSPLSLIEPSPELIQRLQKTGSVHRVLDHGDTAPTVNLWYSVDRDENIFFFREYYQAGYDPDSGKETLLSDHRRNIYELSKSDFETNPPGWRYRTNLADPSIFDRVPRIIGGRSVSGRFSVADEYTDPRHGRETSIPWAPADNNEKESILRLREYLHVDPHHIHPITKEKGSPRVFFVQRTDDYPHGCVRSISELRGQRRVLLFESSGTKHWGDERDKKIVDHAFDCVRYAVMSRPAVGEISHSTVPLRVTQHTEGPAAGRWTIPAAKLRDASRRAARAAR